MEDSTGSSKRHLMQAERLQTSSEKNLAPAAFNLNQSSAVCLPLVSDNKRLIWVHSNQINLQLDGAAELDKAFDRFPYLTQNQTAALAQRCSLHPDQVKVWFMVQRLRYGISWDYKDILNVRRKFNTSREKQELKNDRRKKNKWKRDVKESGMKKVGEVREDQNEGRIIGENVRATEQLEIKIKQEQPVKDRCVELHKDERNTQKKRKRMPVTDKMGKKKRADEGVVERAGEVEVTSDEVERESTRSKLTQSKITCFTRQKNKTKANKRPIQEWPAQKSVVVPDEVLDVSSLVVTPSQTQDFGVSALADNQTSSVRMRELETKPEGKLCAESTNPDGAPTDSGKLKELEEVTDPVVAQRRSATTQSQLMMMRAAFLHCQYPDSEAYNQLAMLVGVPRAVLVQWFSDTRYYIKKGILRWMNQEQHRQVLANVKYRQSLNKLANSCECGGNATWKMKLARRENCGKDESVQVPLEEK